MSQKSDIYDISNYTDAELMQLLDVPANITDRELEAKILQNIYKYNNIGNESGFKLANFFTNIYSRLFEVSDDEEVGQEGFTLMQNASGGWEYEGDNDRTPFDGNYTYLESSSRSKFGTNDPTTSITRIQNNTTIAPDENQIMRENSASTVQQREMGKTIKKEDIAITKQVDYHKDYLNPILKQTIKRIISIDSQFRQDKNASSTSFTFNLSEPLRDVVSLKLYSVQIPYTWYTINNNFGGNFFYIKGNTPGIEDQEYKIQIDSGVYTTAALLIEEVSKNLTTVIQNNPSVNFGNTKIEYLSTQVKTQFTFDITDIYNQNMYSIYFPNDIANFLGFNKLQQSGENKYTQCGSVYSDSSLSPITTISNNINLTLYIYSYTYDSQHYKYDDSRIINTITINFGTIHADTTYQSIVDRINGGLQNNSNLVSTYSSCKITDSSYAQINIMFNKEETIYQEHLRYAIKLTDTNTPPSGNIIGFKNDSIYECNTLQGIIPNMITEFKLLDTQTYSIKFECINSSYSNVSNNSLLINFSSSNVFTLDSLITKLNNDMSNYNSSPQNTTNIINNSRFYIDTNNKLAFKAELKKEFNNTHYQIKSNYSYLRHDINNADNGFINMDPIDLSYISYNIIRPTDSNYRINSTITIKPKSNTDNLGQSQISVDISTGNSQIYTFSEFCNHIYGKIISNPYLATSTRDINTPEIIKIKIRNNLLTNDYKLHFYTYTNQTESPYNFWQTKLMFDFSYILLNNYNRNSNTTNIQSQLNKNNTNQLNLVNGRNNTFYIQAHPINGLIGSDAETIMITLTANEYANGGTYYSQTSLIDEINRKLLENKFLYYSSINFTNSLNVESSEEDLYLKSSPITVNFDIMFTKKYTSSDYKIVFYDPTNFVKCYIGYDTAKNATWDSTLGWILGFRNNVEYLLTPEIIGDNIILLKSDTCVSVNIYNYFLIMLDDYTQSHINDGLVTISMADNIINAPSNITFTCDSNTEEKTVVTDGITARQAQANAEKLNSIRNKIMQKSYSSGPFVRDIFGLLPIKTTGMQAGQVYVEFGGTLQNQERTYFGPVNIHRMTIKLLTDRGDLVDLNNANWSFSFICETLYKQ